MRVRINRGRFLLGVGAGLASAGSGLAYAWYESAVLQPRAERERGLFPARGLPAVGRLAYVREGDMWVLDLGRGDERRLTRTGRVHTPQWSGNGRWLSYQEGPALWIAQPDSGETQRLHDSVVAASWSPRFAQLAYATEAGALLTAEPERTDRRQRELFPAGGEIGALVWSPDGVRIVVERRAPLTPQGLPLEALWLTNVLGREPLPVLVAAGRSRISLAGWTNDERALLFWQGFTAAAAADVLPLFAMPLPSGRAQLVAEAVLPYRRWLASSPHGDRLAFVDGGGAESWRDKRLRLVQTDALLAQSGGSLATEAVAGSDEWADTDPAWAPDGLALAFSRAHSAAPQPLQTRRIWIADLNGRPPRPLFDAGSPAAVALEPGGQERPRWSRQGRFLLFARRTGGQVELWLANQRGSEARRVTAGLSDPAPSTSGYLPWEQVYDWWPE